MIDTRIWHDGWVRKLSALERYLFIYLLSNDKCSFCGIYELPISLMSFETGIGEQELEDTMLPRLEPKVYYHNGWVYLINFKKHHVSEKSNNSKKGYDSALNDVPRDVLEYFSRYDSPLKPLISPSDTITLASTITSTFTSTENTTSQDYLKQIPSEDLKEFTDRFEVSVNAIKSKAEELANYCTMHGKRYKNYKAFLLNALKRDFRERPPKKEMSPPKVEEKLTPDQEREKQLGLESIRKKMSLKL